MDDEQVRLRARVMVIVALGMASTITIGWFLRLAISPLPWTVRLTVCISWLLFLSALGVLRLGAVHAAGSLLVAAFFVVIFGSAIWVGGLQAPVILLAPILPMMATVLLDFRAGIWSTVLASLLIVGFLAGSLFGFFELTPPLGGPEETQARALLAIVGCLMAMFFAFFYEKHRGYIEGRREISEELYRKLFEGSKDTVALSTPDGRLLDVNSAGVEFYGFESKEEMLNQHVSELYSHQEDRQELLKRLARDGYVRGYESRQRLRDGRARVVRGTTSVILGDNGEIQYLLAILHDVTEERRAAHQIKKMLLQVEAKNQELERFGYTVSHDLKSPLLTLKGFLALLERDLAGQVSDKVARDIAAIGRAADTMQRLVEDLLQYSRLGHESGSWMQIPLEDLAKDAAEMLGGRAEEKGIQVRVDSNLPVVFGQMVLLRMVLLNLIDNAIKYARHEVRVGARYRDDLEGWVCFVQDDGPGIEPEMHERVFGLFEKLDAASEGTGIGLASVKRAVTLHGGEIWVESELGKGASFCFKLLPEDYRNDEEPDDDLRLGHTGLI